MRNSNIAALAIMLLAHAFGGSLPAAHAQQATVERTPLCTIVLHDRIGSVIERGEAETYRLFTSQRMFRSATIFRDADTVAWACIEREGALPDTLVRISDPLLVSMAQKVDQWDALQQGTPFIPNLPPAMRERCPLSDAERERIRLARAGGARPRLDATLVVEPPAPARDTVVGATTASASTARTRTVRTVRRASDADVLPFAWSVADPTIPRTYLFAIGGGIGVHAFPRNGPLNARLAELQTGLSFNGFNEGSFSVRAFLPWGITVGVESATKVADAFVRYELPVLGSVRLFAGIGIGRTEHMVENTQSVALSASSGTLLHAGLFLPFGSMAIEASANYCDAREQREQFRDYNPQSHTYADPVDVWFDPSRSSLRLQLFIMF